jgi:hypothetical protein
MHFLSECEANAAGLTDPISTGKELPMTVAAPPVIDAK